MSAAIYRDFSSHPSTASRVSNNYCASPFSTKNFLRTIFVISILAGGILICLGLFKPFAWVESPVFVYSVAATVVTAVFGVLLAVKFLNSKKEIISADATTKLSKPSTLADKTQLPKPSTSVDATTELARPPKFPFSDLPNETKAHVLSFLSFGDLRSSLTTSKAFLPLAQLGVIERARQLGYEGDEDTVAAHYYLKQFYRAVYQVVIVTKAIPAHPFSDYFDGEIRFIPEEDLDRLAFSLQSLTVEQIYTLYSQQTDPQKMYKRDDVTYLMLERRLLTDYFLSLVDNNQIRGKISKKNGASLEMVFACIVGDIKLIELLLRLGVDPNLPLNSGRSTGSVPLHFAAQQGHTEIVRLLLDHEADINATTDKNNALSYALGAGSTQKSEKEIIETVDFLLKNGINLHYKVPGGFTYLHLAARWGHTGVIERFLDAGLDLNSRGNLGETPLFFAIQNTDTEERILPAVTALLKEGADPNIQTHQHVSPLSVAIGRGFVKVATLLVKANAQVNVLTEQHQTLLESLVEYCPENSVLELIDLLLQKGADPTLKGSRNVPFHLAIGKNYLKVVTAFLQATCTRVDAKNNEGKTILYHVISKVTNEEDLLPIVSSLLEKGADPNLTTNNQDAPLHVALCGGFFKVAVKIIEAKGDVKAPSQFGRTPLELLLRYALPDEECMQALKLLLALGADPHQKNNKGRTALYFAARSQRADLLSVILEQSVATSVPDNDNVTPLGYILKGNADEETMLSNVKLLVEKGGVNVNEAVLDKATSLMLAFEKGFEKIVVYLLEKGADINARNAKGKTVLLKEIEREGDLKVKMKRVAFLIEKGALVTLSDNLEVTPLHYAALFGYFDMAKLFLDKGAEINVCDSEGLTPLYYAYHSGYEEVSALLLSLGGDDTCLTPGWHFKN